ncbi:MAG: phosphoribosylformimino-5-aminoimidazole carboxamide ribotide isomerase, partial [ANME-2 cluster archaeon]
EVVDHSNHNIILGGGIRNLKDISLLKDIGLEGALVATSVHNGSIPVDMIQ